MIWLVLIRIHARVSEKPSFSKPVGYLVAEQKQLLFIRNKKGDSS